MSTHQHASRLIQPTRRGFLSGITALAAAGGAVAMFTGQANAGPLLPGRGTQPNWRYCSKCKGMFWDGQANFKGRCPAGGAHTAQGHNFSIAFDDRKPGAPSPQYDWRFCEKCWTMFFDGYPTKGACPGGGSHSAQGFMFGLVHVQPNGGIHQGKWGFCDKCFGLHYFGYGNRGVCPAGGQHRQQGWEFWIPNSGGLPPVSSPAPAAATDYNNAVLAYARGRIGQKIGRGECSDLAVAALASAGARAGTFPADGHYVWGTKLNLWSQAPLPGDILQMVNLTLSYRTATSWGSMSASPQHTAIIETVNGKTLGVIQQNAPVGSAVSRGTVDFNWTLERGDYAIYRPVK